MKRITHVKDMMMFDFDEHSKAVLKSLTIPQKPSTTEIMAKLEFQEHMMILLLKKLTRMEARLEALPRIEERLAALELKDF